jgi:hypothetical protein
MPAVFDRPVRPRKTPGPTGEFAIRDKKRVATASIAGYRYQLLHTLREWLELTDDSDRILAEGNEDFDHLGNKEGRVSESQIKHVQGTLSTSSTRETLFRFLEAFLELRKTGSRFRGVLRTTQRPKLAARTPLDLWVAGTRPSTKSLAKLLRTLATNAKTKKDVKELTRKRCIGEFLNSIEWAPSQPSASSLEATLKQSLEVRGAVPGDEALRSLIAKLTQIASEDSAEARLLSRLTLDIAINDFLISKLVSSQEQPREPGVLLGAFSGPPSRAVVVAVDDVSRARSSIGRILKSHGVRPEADLAKVLIERVDFIAYVSVRNTLGRRGLDVCVRDVVRQARVRHRPNLLFSCSGPRPKWPPFPSNWPATWSEDPVLTRFGDEVGGRLVGDPIDMLKLFGTKLRWVHVIDQAMYHTAQDASPMTEPTQGQSLSSN